MKRLFKKSLVCILILFIVINFLSASVINYGYASEGVGFVVDSIFTGLIGVITWIPRAIIMALLTGLNALISAFAHLGLGDIDGYGTISSNIFVTPFHVFFNKIAILDVNFFNFEGVSGTVLTFRTAVAGWYYTIRLIACMVLAVILIYIGIRMAISTIAQEKAMYKKMLVDWVTSLALLFLLHYIMVFTFACNDALVNALATICEEMDLTGFIGQLTAQALGLDTSSAIAAMILYGIIIGQTISFIFAYVKRMLTIGFLIMIAPLITITYSIDKIGDGKAQALNIWLKEFVFNILIQPFHCILFAAFASVAFELIGVGTWKAGSSLAEMILAIACIQFIKTGEQLVRKIFGFGEHGSMATMAAGTAVAMAALSKGGDVGKAVGAGAAKTKNLISQNKDKISNATKGLSSKVGNMTKQLAKVDKNGQLTARGRKIAEKKAEKMTDKQKASNPGLKNQDNYAAAHQKNYEDITKKMTRRVTNKNDKIEKKAERKKEKASAKERDAAVNLATKKLQAKGDNRPPNEEQIQAAAKEIKANKEQKAKNKEKRHEKAREITGVATNFMKKNGDKIASNTFGAISGIVGFGVNGMQGAMVGAKFGSGLYTGYMSNTDKTLEKQNKAEAQSVANMSEDDENFDMEAETCRIYATAQNGGYDKIEEKLNQILSQIQSLSGNNKRALDADIRKQLIVNPAGLNMDFLKDLSDKYEIPEEQRDSVKQFARLAAEANYAQSINASVSTGRTIGEVASVVSNITVQGQSAEEIARAVEANVTVESGIGSSEINNLNRNIDRVNDDIGNLNSSTGKINDALNKNSNNTNKKPV